MCNFYMMYWIDGTDPLKMTKCFSLGPPIFYWKRFPLTNIPEEDASTID
jgi:peptidylglycine monooxygenase